MKKGSKANGGRRGSSAKLRGVAARSRDRRYGIDIRTQAFNYRQGLQASLLLMRLQKDVRAAKEALASFDALCAFEANRFARQPIGFDYLSILTTPSEIPLEQEVRWLATRLSRHMPNIESFLEKKQAIESSAFHDRPQDALETIELLESEEGVSLWSVSTTIAILQWFYGVEAQKAFVARLRQLNKVAMLPYVANYVSQLCEETVTLGWYRESLKRRLTGHEVSDITVYMESKLGAEWPRDDAGIAIRLRIEQNHHDFDMYESLVEAVQILGNRCSLRDGLKLVVLEVCDTFKDLSDIRLSKVEAYLADAPQGLVEDTVCESFESLLEGRFLSARRQAARALNRSPGSLLDAVVCAVVATHFPIGRVEAALTSSVARAIVAGLVPVLTRDHNAAIRHDHLEKLCVMFSGFNFAVALQSFIEAERADNPDQYLSGLRKFAMTSPAMGPMESALLMDGNVASPLAAVQVISNMRAANASFNASVIPEIRIFAESFRAALSGNGYDSSAALALAESNSRWIRSHAALVSLQSCLLRGDIGEASRIISTEVCLHGTAPELLPINEVFKGLGWRDLAHHATSLHFLNAFHLYVEQSIDDKAPTHRRFAISKFLMSLELQLPSELRSVAEQFDARELTFFLGKVCTLQSIDMLPGLKSSAQVLEERRAICSVILSISREAMSEYEDEIVSISKDLAVQQGLRAYDGSRVHVDRSGLKKVLRHRLSESYARYTALVQSGVGVGDDFDEVLRDLIRNEGGSKYFLSVPDNEADELLHSIMKEVRHGFLLNIPHGLDSYLSKRVRHGSIVGHIRGAVEQEKVILQRGIGQKYAGAIALTGGLPAAEAEALGGALASFSKAFDSYLLRLKDVLLHVRTADRPLGIFDLSYNAGAVHLIRSAYKTDATFDGLLDSVLSVFWSLMTPSLGQAQHLLRVEANKTLTEQLQVLRQRVQEVVSDPAERGRIGGAISRAITSAQAKLETAAGWFDPSHLEPREYTAEEAISIGLASVKAINFGFDPEIVVEADQLSAIGATYLPIFVDVLFIIFGNIAEKANCGLNPRCVVNITHPRSGLLRVRVENQVTIEEPFEDCVARMEKKKGQIEAGELSARVREEGDSGLAKLASIAFQSVRGSLNFGYRDERTFFVEVDLSLVGDDLSESERGSE